MEYDFEVAPGAEPGDIGIAIEGADRMRLGKDGDLVLGTPVGFRVGAYDRSRPLLIDPVLTYSTYLGGADNEEGFSIAMDASGDLYVAGRTRAADFPVKNALQPGYVGTYPSSDVFVTNHSGVDGSLIYSDDPSDLGLMMPGSPHDLNVRTSVPRDVEPPSQGPVVALPEVGCPNHRYTREA